MLVDVVLQDNQIGKMIAAIGGYSTETIKLGTGLYEIGHFNFDHSIGNDINEYPDFKGDDEYLGPYGVCDEPEQVLQKYDKWLNGTEKNYCVSFTKLTKKGQPEQGGWRWHKWGQYIGTKEPQHEYLYDEGDDIEYVYCYHIYEILN